MGFSDCDSNSSNPDNYYAFEQSISRFEFNVLETVFGTLDGILLVCTNLVFISLLIRHRKRHNWSGGLFQLNISISDLLSGTVILVLCGVMFANLHDVPHFVRIVVQLLLTASVMVTGLSYWNTFFVQFLAIEKPIFYRNKCTKRIRFLWAFSVWLLAGIYVGAKGAVLIICCSCAHWFANVEVGFMGLLICSCAAMYGYVLYIAYKKITEKLKRKNLMFGLSHERSDAKGAVSTNAEPLRVR